MKNNVISVVFAFLLCLGIVGLLMFTAVQAKKNLELERAVVELERKQQDLIEKNKQLITDISLLSNSDRIEKIAQEELGMRKAESEEIVRVDVDSGARR